MSGSDQLRAYSRKDSVVFLKTDEPFGGLSNMAGRYPIHVNGIRILTSEALYQVCRFPHLPEVQRMIIGQNSPMTAKMRSKPYRKDSRSDWDQVRVRIMRWCLRMKLANNWSTFSELLLRTGDRSIVEESRKDDFWGAKPSEDASTLVGMNVLGRLLMELREQVRLQGREAALDVAPPPIPQFLLLGRPIDVTSGSPPPLSADSKGQGSLFDSDAAVSIPTLVPPTTASPYPSYRASGLPWAPQVPESWQVMRNGRLFAHRVETGFPELPILEVSLRTGVRVRDMENLKRKQVMSQKDKYKRAAKDDIAYNMMRMWQGAVGPTPVEGLVSPAYVVIKPYPEANSSYFSYLFRTVAYMQEVNKFSRGIVADRNRLYWESFKQMPSLVPPRPEQGQIVAYLRAQDAHIARFIKAKRELIGLLTEQKLRIIDHAVTRGLDASVKLKPSGIEWLGDIPVGWDIARLRTLTSRITSGSRGWSDYAADEGPLFLRVGNLTRGSVKLNLDRIVRLELPLDVATEATRTRVRSGDVLLSITAYIGSVAHVPEGLPEAYVSQHVACCTLRPEAVDSKWVAYVLLSSVGKTHGAISMYGGTKQGLTLSDVKSYVVLLPPRDEQLRLVAEIDSATAAIDAAIEREKQAITLIREYRDRLIFDAVTGQLDVRNWQPGPGDIDSDEILSALADDEGGEADEAEDIDED